MANTRAGRLVAVVIILVGAVLLIAALFTPWYSYEISGHSASETANFYLGVPSTSGTIQYSCSGISFCQTQTSYSQKDLNNSGMIAEAAFFLLIGGLVLGIIAGLVGMAYRGSSRRTTFAIALALVALILAVSAPGLFAAALPGAISSDHNLGSPGGNGPWNSFYGSSSTTFLGVSATTTWGPALGWYLSIVAVVFLLVGAILLFRARRESPAPTTVPAPAAAPSAVPPST
jgi:hypothetical protein